MTHVILKAAAGRLLYVLLGLSLIVYYRGHNEPGGGFIGGLMAASGYIFYMLAHGVTQARRKMRIKPLWLISAGQSVALAAALWPVFIDKPFFTGLWLKIAVTPSFVIKLGTPMLFDLGVYLLVWGAVTGIVLNIEEE